MKIKYFLPLILFLFVSCSLDPTRITYPEPIPTKVSVENETAIIDSLLNPEERLFESVIVVGLSKNSEPLYQKKFSLRWKSSNTGSQARIEMGFTAQTYLFYFIHSGHIEKVVQYE